MRNKPTPAFAARVIDALPADGTPITPRNVWLSIGKISTPAYVRIVLRELALAGRIAAARRSCERVYHRPQPQMEVA